VGDQLSQCTWLAKQVGIDEVMAEQTPEQNWKSNSQLAAIAPTAMVVMALMMRLRWRKPPSCFIK
jgi:cation transport ATPase